MLSLGGRWGLGVDSRHGRSADLLQPLVLCLRGHQLYCALQLPGFPCGGGTRHHGDRRGRGPAAALQGLLWRYLGQDAAEGESLPLISPPGPLPLVERTV